MEKLLKRYKIFILFILLMLTPTLHAVLSILSLLGRYLLFTHGATLFLSMVIYQIMGLLWVILQQAVFENNPWRNYFLSLPITEQQKIVNDVLSLCLINGLLWLPLLLVFLQNAIMNAQSGLAFALLLGKCLLNIFLVLFIQIAWLNRNQILTSLWIKKHHAAGKKNKLAFTQSNDRKIRLKKRNKHTVYAIIQLKHLLLMMPSALIIPGIFLLLTLSLSTVSHTYFIFALTNALILSNFFEKLHAQRNHYLAYLPSLSISWLSVFISDLLIVGSAVSLCNICFYILMAQHVSNTLFTPSMIMSLIYLMTIYYPQIKLKIYGILVSLMILPLFIFTSQFLLTFRM